MNGLGGTSAGSVVPLAGDLRVPSLTPAATAAADGCSPGVSSDSNGDGFADAVVADSTATVAGRADAGRLVVYYGGSDGRIGEGVRRVVHQASGTVNDAPETGDRFGFALAAADLDCDDFTDLVVGSPYEDAGGTDSGLVQIIWGTTTRAGHGPSVGHAQSGHLRQRRSRG